MYNFYKHRIFQFIIELDYVYKIIIRFLKQILKIRIYEISK